MGILGSPSPTEIGLRERERRPSELQLEFPTSLRIDEQEEYPDENAEEILVAS